MQQKIYGILHTPLNVGYSPVTLNSALYTALIFWESNSTGDPEFQVRTSQKAQEKLKQLQELANSPALDVNAQLLTALKLAEIELRAIPYPTDPQEEAHAVILNAISAAEASRQPVETPDPLHMTEALPTPHEGNNQSRAEWRAE